MFTRTIDAGSAAGTGHVAEPSEHCDGFCGQQHAYAEYGAAAVGDVLRFNGLVFNDNGTLRMDCAQVNDGVPE
jgi:hypothetical protein